MIGWSLWPTDLNRILVASLVLLWHSRIMDIFTSDLRLFFSCSLVLGNLNPQLNLRSRDWFGQSRALHCSGSLSCWLFEELWRIHLNLSTSTFILPWHHRHCVWQMSWSASWIMSCSAFSISLVQVDLCLICPKHFDSELCRFPAALDANCHLAFLRLTSCGEPVEVIPA